MKTFFIKFIDKKANSRQVKIKSISEKQAVKKFNKEFPECIIMEKTRI